MKSQHFKILILSLQITGFLSIIILCWLDETLALPARVFGDPLSTAGNWHEAVWETICITMVAIPIVVASTLMVRKLHYLENFIRVCAWCRKVHLNDTWIPVENYLSTEASIECSHGICEECAKQLVKDEPREVSNASV